MPFLPADIARCTVFTDMPDGVVANNRFTAAYNGTTSLDDADALNDWSDYLDEIYSVVAPDMADSLAITRFELYKSTVVAGKEVLEFIGVGTIANQPSNVNDMIPHGACMQFNARLTGTGRGSAKKFWPGFVEDGVVNGIFQAAVIANMAPALTTWISDFGASDFWIPGTWSISKGFRGMQLPIARNVVAYQRRRKPGVGS